MSEVHFFFYSIFFGIALQLSALRLDTNSEYLEKHIFVDNFQYCVC